MQQVASRVTIKVDGQVVLNREGFTFRKGGIARTAVVGDSGVHGYSESQVAARLAGNVTANERSTLDSFDVSDATILAELNDGTSWVMRQAFRTDVPELDIGEGQYGIAFEGPAAERT